MTACNAHVVREMTTRLGRHGWRAGCTEVTRMPRIATLTANPALDLNVVLPRVVPEHKLRCSAPIREPGGGGINVARAIRNLGGDARAMFPIGGATGQLLVRLLDAEGVAHGEVAVQDWTRENLHVTETETGHQFRFCMPGAALTEREWRRLFDDFTAVEPAPELAVLSGSLAPGMPVDFYAQVAERLHRRDARVVLDTSGDALRSCAGRGVYLVKASVRELEMLAAAGPADEDRLLPLARGLIEAGTCTVLVVSLGAGGALWVTAGEHHRVVAPRVKVSSTVGAGDAMVAGIVLALARNWPLADAIRYGVAAGTAAVLQPGTALCRRDDVERLYLEVTQS
ncbi:MAG TPA: 1-phosphofructokinase family hexose kinase [Kofleriaceae bacterium]|nr:1-phosphofructokinase family hexose kinase [Kofleriaceae bacterium]